jgi:hypothetical protein
VRGVGQQRDGGEALHDLRPGRHPQVRP